MRHIYVPQYESLTLDKIIGFLKDNHEDVLDYLPPANEIHKISKEWICNIITTRLGTTFTDWLKERIDERNERVVERGEMNIELDPDVAAAFRASTAVSCKCNIFLCHRSYLYHSGERLGRQYVEGRGEA